MEQPTENLASFAEPAESPDDAIARLKSEQPAMWEYLLFAALLRRSQERLRRRRRDHELRLPGSAYHRVDEDRVVDYISTAFGELGWLIAPLNRVFEAQEDAFGKPGEPGNPILIEHFADWIAQTYEGLLDWAGRLRSAGVPDDFERALELAAQAADKPARQIWDFMDHLTAEVAKIPAHLAIPEHDRRELIIDATLVLEADEEVLTEALEALRSALGQS